MTYCNNLGLYKQKCKNKNRFQNFAKQSGKENSFHSYLCNITLEEIFKINQFVKHAHKRRKKVTNTTTETY